MLVVDHAAVQGWSLPVRFAGLTHDLGKGTTPPELLPNHRGHEARSVALLDELCQRLRVPADCRDLARLAARHHGDIHRALELRPETIVRLFQSADAFRRPERFAELLRACTADCRGRAGRESEPYPQADYLLGALQAASGVDAGAVAALQTDPATIGAAVMATRIDAVRQYRAQVGG